LVEGGTDLYTVKELIGHSTLQMAEHYSHLGANTLQQAVRNLDQSMQKDNKKAAKVVNIDEARR
jgi:site-specific recombinase XerD